MWNCGRRGWIQNLAGIHAYLVIEYRMNSQTDKVETRPVHMVSNIEVTTPCNGCVSSKPTRTLPRGFDGHLTCCFQKGANALPWGSWRKQNPHGGTVRKNENGHPWDSVKTIYYRDIAAYSWALIETFRSSVTANGRRRTARSRKLPPTLERKDSGINFHGLSSLAHKRFTQTIFNALSNRARRHV